MATDAKIIRGFGDNDVTTHKERSAEALDVNAQSGDWLTKIDSVLSASRSSLLGVGIEPIAEVITPPVYKIPSPRDSDDLMARIASMA